MPVPSHILAKIHIAKKQLGLDDMLYREILMSCAGVSSAKNLNAEGANKVLRHFAQCGWTASPPKKAGRRPSTSAENHPLMRKVEALLADQRRPWAYVHAMAKRMFGIDQVGWCDAEQLQKIVAALSIDAKRKG